MFVNSINILYVFYGIKYETELLIEQLICRK